MLPSFFTVPVNDVRRFIEQAKKVKKPGDLQNIDAVLQVSVSACKGTDRPDNI